MVAMIDDLVYKKSKLGYIYNGSRVFLIKKGYGYKHIGFILDRGYFSKANIQALPGLQLFGHQINVLFQFGPLRGVFFLIIEDMEIPFTFIRRIQLMLYRYSIDPKSTDA